MPKIDFSSAVVHSRRFFAGARTGKLPAIRVLAAGVENVTPHYTITRTTFPSIGVEFVAGGEGELLLDGRQIQLQAGILFCYGPRTPHQIRTDPDNRLVKYFVDFEGTDASALCRRTGILPGSAFASSSPAGVMTIFDELIRAGTAAGKFMDEVSQHLLIALLYRMSETAIDPGTIASPSFSTYAKIRDDIEQHAREIASLSQLADRHAIDEAYLCRLFKRYDFQSPYQKLQRLRMQHAAEQLRSGEKLAKQVARELGFSDPFHFSRAFKRVMGFAPSHLRKGR